MTRTPHSPETAAKATFSKKMKRDAEGNDQREATSDNELQAQGKPGRDASVEHVLILKGMWGFVQPLREAFMI